jgi:hypothetical protein
LGRRQIFPDHTRELSSISMAFNRITGIPLKDSVASG